MVASLISMFPSLIAAGVAVLLTWIICRLWYTSRYIHRDEVRPLQESQHIMQNQYAILAERIKQTDAQLAEAKARLDAASEEKEHTLINLVSKEVQANTPYVTQEELNRLFKEFLTEIKATGVSMSGSTVENDTEKMKLKEQLNLVRQGFKEFKTEMAQKLNASSNQYHELSNQLWQLIELNKKLSTEAETLNKSLHVSDQDEKAERHFTLTSIKKRS